MINIMNSASVLIRPMTGLSKIILAMTYQSTQMAVIKGNMLQSRNRDDRTTKRRETA